MTMNKAALGLVTTHAQAEDVVVALREVGFLNSDISVLFPDKNATRDFAYEQSTKAPEGAVAGAGAGGAIGGTLGLLAGIGAIAIPGLGPLIAAGPILAALTGVAAGGVVGGLGGALIGMGIPEIEAKQYENKVKGGSILISVHVTNGTDLAHAKRVLETHGASHIVTMGEKKAA